MGHDQLFDAVLLLGLFWLSMLVYGVWLQKRRAVSQTTPTPTTSIKKHSKKPTPFVGLIHKPHCDACENTIALHPQVPSSLPPLLTFTQGRQRTIDTQQHFCPTHECPYYGWVGRGNIRANGHPGGKPWRQLQCVACHRYCQETHGTPLHGKRVPPEMLVWAVGALAEGLGLRAVARVFAVDPNTVLAWLREVADHAAAFSRHFLHDVHATQVQLDELFALLRPVKAGEVSETEAMQRQSRTPDWVWGAIDPVTKLLLALDVGDRTLAVAQGVVHQVVQVLAPDCVPLFVTDGFKEYTTALLTHFGQWVQPPCLQAKGPVPKPRWMPLPQLLYAQVVKSYRRRRMVRVRHRVVFGTLERVTQVLASTNWQINTAFVERLNLTIRQHVAAVGRRVITLCKSDEGLCHQLALYHTYYNFCVPHTSLRLALPQPLLTKGSGSTKRWQPQTPAMAAGLTNHVWTLREVLLYRVPPWSQLQAR
jgi:IS1 family transposase